MWKDEFENLSVTSLQLILLRFVIAEQRAKKEAAEAAKAAREAAMMERKHKALWSMFPPGQNYSTKPRVFTDFHEWLALKAADGTAEAQPAKPNSKAAIDAAKDIYHMGGLLFILAKEFPNDGRYQKNLQEWENFTGLKADDCFRKLTDEEVEQERAAVEQERAAIEAEVKKANAGWPWTDCPPKLLLEAPFSLNRFNTPKLNHDLVQLPGKGFFRLPVAWSNGDCKLFKLPDVALRKVYGHVFEYHSSASSFVSTCQIAFMSMSNMAQHWDMSRPYFEDADAPKRTPPSKFIIVSPHRLRGESKTDAVPESMTAVHQIRSLITLTDNLHCWGQRIETLHFHRVPLLMVPVLELVLPNFSNLRFLGVYRCPLIHFGDTLKLLDLVEKCTNKQAAGAGKPVPPVKLDFFPRFHVGPVRKNQPDSHGSYGVTWENSELDTRLAIWCLVEKAIKKAEAQGIVECIMAPESALRIFIEKLCWNVGPTMKAIFEGTHADDGSQMAALYDFPRTAGDKKKLRLADENGDRLWGRIFNCATCQKDNLGIFFTFHEHRNRMVRRANCKTSPTLPMHCLGCKLTDYLKNEGDHSKQADMLLVGHWLLLDRSLGLFSNTNDIEWALGETMRTYAERMAGRHVEPFRQTYFENKQKGEEVMQQSICKRPEPPLFNSPVLPFISAKITDGKTHETNAEPYGPIRGGAPDGVLIPGIE